ncbi:group II intron reverse transcriptase/maturase [Xylella fastidiosa]|uniref:group II intron reverse transcriptase/maturase n=1 Tax=Xylella fastidiosa TaxID=2371 RepID=UPI000B14EB83|nr:group II intron reverse transcriptase/maturase [Xylella fastidiosa]MDG5822959.1 group II intron reverse transcriptase/maturase [Xylella fastidiosa subsp. pauca]MDG5825197.1 group II intron reverse transcriptase/maturase [Xylella fastidiosa subsp. pauca]
MTTQAACAGALSGDSGGWHCIDWANCHREVRRLQTRIVKATQEGRWGKVKALQWLLTHSFSGKALAVRRVTENQGKKTPGVDKVVWGTPEKKENAVDELRRHGHKARPLRRVYIPKSNGKLRPLGIPTMRDRAMQALHLLSLLPVSETQADGCSYGFRPERSVADAVDRCFRALNGQHSSQWILEADIKGCFDHISHDWLLGNVPMDKRMLEMWLKCGFMEAGAWSETEAGTPQGGIISPTLANMALDGLEQLLEQSFRSRMRDRQITNPKVNLVRYADDFVITGDSEKLLIKEVKPLVERFLADRGLTLSAEKTRVTHIDEGFDFLGQNVRKYKGKLLIKPSAASLKNCADKIRAIVRSNKAANQASLIHLLNPVIQGWANFHRHIVAKKTFKSLDDHVWRALWKWALRRHPAKGKKWIRHRYFHA